MDPKMMVSNRNALFQDAMLVGGVYMYNIWKQQLER